MKAAEPFNSRFLQRLKLARGRSCFEEGTRHARCMVLLVAVGTMYAKVGTARVLAGRRVLCVEGGEVGSRTLIAAWASGAAHIGSVAPLEAHRALSRGGGDGPGLASSDDTNKGDGCLK